MKKIKSEEALFQEIDSEMSWRRIEIHHLKSLLKIKKNSKEKDVLAKSVILISYSHWEGFVKSISMYYLSYIAFLALPKDKMSTNLIASCLIRIGENQNMATKIKELHKALTDNTYKLAFNIDKLVDAESNLNSVVLDKILVNIGASTSTFETKSIFIDSILLKNRNDFAHGDRARADFDTAIDIADTVLTLMELYKTEIENMIALKSYRI